MRAQEMDMDNRMALYQHVILSGGSTLFPGLPTRLERDIRALYLRDVLKARASFGSGTPVAAVQMEPVPCGAAPACMRCQAVRGIPCPSTAG